MRGSRRAFACRAACARGRHLTATSRLESAVHDSSSCTGVPEKVAKLLNAHAKHTYADCAVDDPQTEAPLLQIPEVVKTPPRTALATAKRKEVYSSRVWAVPPPPPSFSTLGSLSAPLDACAVLQPGLAFLMPSPGGKVQEPRHSLQAVAHGQYPLHLSDAWHYAPVCVRTDRSHPVLIGPEYKNTARKGNERRCVGWTEEYLRQHRTQPF